MSSRRAACGTRQWRGSAKKGHKRPARQATVAAALAAVACEGRLVIGSAMYLWFHPKRVNPATHGATVAAVGMASEARKVRRRYVPLHAYVMYDVVSLAATSVQRVHAVLHGTMAQCMLRKASIGTVLFTHVCICVLNASALR